MSHVGCGLMYIAESCLVIALLVAQCDTFEVLYDHVIGVNVRNHQWGTFEVDSLQFLGWKIQEDSSSIVILGSDGERRRFELSHRKFIFTARDFSLYAKDLSGMFCDTKKRSSDFQLEEILIQIWLCTVWCRHRGDESNAHQLTERLIGLCRGSREFAGRPAELLASTISGSLRTKAIIQASRGQPRGQILELWRKIAKLGAKKYKDEAEELIRGYEELIADDRDQQVERQSGNIGKNVHEEIRDLIHELRDLAIIQTSEPGYCDITSWLSLASSFQGTSTLKRLIQLGPDVLPYVIEHMDDARPTRCVGFSRRDNVESYYLLRYGDCCQQIFERITGETVFEPRSFLDYPIKNGKGDFVRARANETLERLRNQKELMSVTEFPTTWVICFVLVSLLILSVLVLKCYRQRTR